MASESSPSVWGVADLLQPDPMRQYIDLFISSNAVLQFVAVISFIIFVALLAARTRFPGRYLMLIGTLIRIGAGSWLWIARSGFNTPPVSEQLLLSCIGTLGMAITGIGCLRLVFALMRSSRANAEATA